MARPTLTNRFYIFCQDVALLGPKQTFRHYAGKVQARIQKTPKPLPDTEFDRKFDVDTLQASVPRDLRIQSSSQKHGCAYVPTPEALFRRMLQHVPVNYRDYVFIDIGAGKGLAILIASEFPFKRIIGIEYSEVLAAIAKQNICRYSNQMQQCRDIACLCCDATEFTLPNEPLILYMFNPFQGEVMNNVIKNIERSLEHHPRDLWIIYSTPWEHRKFNRSSKLRTVESNWDFCVYRRVLEPEL